jgi:phosphatidylinositol alpha-mannosyltransferase
MAAGKPVVATNIPGYATVCTNGLEGVLVEPSDAQALALGLVRVLSDRELRVRLGAQGRVSAQKYAWPRVAERVLEEYQRSAQRAKLAPWRQDLANR